MISEKRDQTRGELWFRGEHGGHAVNESSRRYPSLSTANPVMAAPGDEIRISLRLLPSLIQSTQSSDESAEV